MLSFMVMLAEFTYSFIHLFSQHTVLSPCHILGDGLAYWEDVKPAIQVFPERIPKLSEGNVNRQ